MDDELDAKHPASEEEYFISERAAKKINMTHDVGGRVIAVGTTVVRALESVAYMTGNITARHDYTQLYITANHTFKVVDGLLTGLHEPEASHLNLLTAFMPAKKILQTYEEAINEKYLWHEFGDLNLILYIIPLLIPVLIIFGIWWDSDHACIRVLLHTLSSL